jgi:PAS domain S-box-containing protein
VSRSVNQQLRTSVLFWSPLRFLVVVLAVIFAAEASVMFILPYVLPENVSYLVESLCDASLLTLASAPILWRLIIRPLRSAAFTEQAKFAAVVETAADGIITVDESGNIESFNTAAEQIFRYTPEEVIRKSINVLLPPPREIGGLPLSESLDSVIGVRHELTGRRKDGSVFPMEFNVGEVRLGVRRIFTGTLRDITERKQAEETLFLLASIVASSHDAIIGISLDGTILNWNSGAERVFGYTATEARGQPYNFLLPPDRLGEMGELLERLKRGERIEQYETARVRKDDKQIDVSLTLSPVKDASGRTTAASIVVRDVTEHKAAEEQIRSSLKEKEVLLKEIHHRVKNNLQIISSLLNLQSGYIQDARALEVFKEGQSRVRSMALIHEKLYQSKDLARVDFSEYVRNLTAYLFRSYEMNSGRVGLTIQAEDVMLAVDAAIPCGLIINELVSNSLKHAFAGGRSGEISITLRPENEGRLTLVVADNGGGLPADLDPRNSSSLGLQLVNTLARQLGGSIEITNGSGAEFKITFPRMD